MMKRKLPPEYKQAMESAVAGVTNYRHEVSDHLHLDGDPSLIVHALIVLCITALREVDDLGGDGDRLLRAIGEGIAGEKGQ